MRTIAISVLFLLVLFDAKCQSDSLAINSINCDTLITDYDWKTDSLMNEIFNRWESKDFYLLLKKHKIVKIDCGGCEGVAAKIQFYVDADGKMQGITLIHTVKCGVPFDEKLKKDFIDSISAIVFPEILRNKCHQFYVGRLLKC